MLAVRNIQTNADCPAHPVLEWTTLLGTGQAGLGKDAPDHMAFEFNSFSFPEQLGEVSVISFGVTSPCQGRSGVVGNGVGDSLGHRGPVRLCNSYMGKQLSGVGPM